MQARAIALVLVIGVGLTAAPAHPKGQAGPPRHATLPAVSPDGRRIAYLADADGKTDLYVADADGAHVTRLTTTDADEGRPSWSPTGTDVLVARTADGWSTLLAVPVAGGPERVVARVPGRSPMLLGTRVLFATGEWTSMQISTSALDGRDVKLLSDGQDAIWNAVVSPDLRRVAFTRSRQRETQVWTMNANGSDAGVVGPFEGRAQMPAWSPDGTRLAVQVSTPAGGATQARLWTVNLATGQRDPVIADATPHLDEVPAWFPDGLRLAFQSDRSGAFEIWTVEIGGGAPRQITQPSQTK
jgi:Tol biopolymer transport system component